MNLTPNQINEIKSLIDFYNVAFIATNVSPAILSTEDVELLERYGVKLDDLETNSGTETAFRFGMLTDVLKEAELKNLSYKDMKEYIEKRKYIPLNDREKNSLKFLNQNIYTSIKGLGNTIVGDFNEVLIENNAAKRAVYEKIIEQEGKKAVYNRKNARELVQSLQDRTLDYARDFRRISESILSNAFNQGRAATIEREQPEGAKVYIIVQSGACDHCKKGYLEKDGTPKVFLLSELQANGSNQGRKQKDWKPVIPPLHPYCRCTLMRILPGQEYDPKTGVFVTTSERKVERKSRVKIG